LRCGVEGLLHVLVLVSAAAAAALGRDGLPLVAAGAAAAVRRGDGEIDVLLALSSHHEGRDVDNLLTHPDPTIERKHSRSEKEGRVEKKAGRVASKRHGESIGALGPAKLKSPAMKKTNDPKPQQQLAEARAT